MNRHSPAGRPIASAAAAYALASGFRTPRSSESTKPERWRRSGQVSRQPVVGRVWSGRRSRTVGRRDGCGSQARLACPPGELPDLGLLAFGIVLNRQGWRIR